MIHDLSETTSEKEKNGHLRHVVQIVVRVDLLSKCQFYNQKPKCIIFFVEIIVKSFMQKFLIFF